MKHIIYIEQDDVNCKEQDGCLLIYPDHPDESTIISLSRWAAAALALDIEDFIGDRHPVTIGTGTGHFGPYNPPAPAELASNIAVYLARPDEEEPLEVTDPGSAASTTQGGDSFETPVSRCCRCGEDHVATFHRFTHPPEFEGNEYDWWALCPTNGEPILMRIVV